MTAETEAQDSDRLPLWMHVFGWYGTLAIIVAYAGLSYDFMEDGALYQLLNITGAAGVGVVAWKRRAWQPLVLEVVWITVGVTSLLG